MSVHKILLLVGILSCSLPVFADEKILIRADSMTLDINTGESIYTGNVSFIQGNVKLKGNLITVNNKDGSIKHVKIEGTPARYSDNTPEARVAAESKLMDYNVINSQLSMRGAARLEQGERIVESDHILYDTKKKLILAGQSTGEASKPGQRVNITLTPKKERPPE